MTPQELDERIEELVDLIHSSCPYTKPCPVHNQGKRAIKELYRDCIEAVTPERGDKAYYTKHPVTWKPVAPESNAEHYDTGYNQVIDTIEANTKELLG